MASAVTTTSNDVLPKSSSQSSTNGLNNMKQIIDLNHHIKCTIEQLTNDFMDIYLNFQNVISKSSTNDPIIEMHKKPIESSNLKFLNNRQTYARYQLAFCGPNASGKTTFLHSFLKINNILPAGAGPITARIVKFTYTTPSEACLIIYPSIEDAYAENRKEEHKLLLAEYFNDCTTDWKGIQEAIKIHVIRPEVKTEKEFNDWAKKFIEIQIPSPTLELGIDVYDTPGLLFHDYPILKDNLQELVRHVRPTIVFLYANATFAKDANDCYLMVRSGLGDLEQPSIFYLNTKQDITTLFNSVGITSRNVKQFTVTKYQEILPNERLKRYQLLYKAIGIANNLPIIENNVSIEIFNRKCDNFDICSIVGVSLLRECAIEMTEKVCQRIIEFAVKTEMKQPYEMVDLVLAKIDNIFNFAASTSHRTQKQLDKTRFDAKRWSDKFFQKFQQHLSQVTETVYENILQRFDQHSDNIIERAIKLERSDDPLHTETKDIIRANIKNFIKIVVQEEIIKVVINEFVNEAKYKFQSLVKYEILVSTEKNELLTTAQRQVLIDISSNDITQRGWIETILYQISIGPSALLRLIRGVSTLPYQDYWNKLDIRASDAKDKFYEILDSMDSFSILIDQSKRREFAIEVLKKRRLKITARKDLYNQNLKLWIENKKKMFDDNIQNNYYLTLSRLANRRCTYESIKTYIKRFAEVECKLVAIKDLAKFNGQNPDINESEELGHGTHFAVYPAEWATEKNLAVKRLKQSSNEYAYLQYLEAHHHRKITQLRLTIPSKREEEPLEIRMPRIVPLLYLYERQENNNQVTLYMFLPKYPQSLDKYLQDNISKIKADQVIQIALDMADVLVLLHANEIVHRDIKAKNILMDENLQCYLADFGTAREWITNSTILGTLPLPPEVNSGSIYDGTVADVYSFGIFLYELLPKKSYSRPDSIKTIQEMLESISPLNEHNRIYENLIKSCLQLTPKDRPNAVVIKSILLECLKELEKKSCIICEDKLRKLRFEPCGHKLLCEPCYNNLPKNFDGKSNCILCRQIIDQWTEDNNNFWIFSNSICKIYKNKIIHASYLY
jgi:serine/threonine protein kinase